MENLEEKFRFNSMERTSQMIDDEREHYQRIMEKIRTGISTEKLVFANNIIDIDNEIIVLEDGGFALNFGI
jgi:hypothetical protein